MRKKIEIKQKNCQKIEGDILLIMVTKDIINMIRAVSYTHLRAHETGA